MVSNSNSNNNDADAPLLLTGKLLLLSGFFFARDNCQSIARSIIFTSASALARSERGYLSTCQLQLIPTTTTTPDRRRAFLCAASKGRVSEVAVVGLAGAAKSGERELRSSPSSINNKRSRKSASFGFGFGFGISLASVFVFT